LIYNKTTSAVESPEKNLFEKEKRTSSEEQKFFIVDGK